MLKSLAVISSAGFVSTEVVNSLPPDIPTMKNVFIGFLSSLIVHVMIKAAKKLNEKLFPEENKKEQSDETLGI